LGCVTRRSIKVYYKTKPAASLGNDSLICGAFYALRPGHADSYEWSTGSSDSVFTPISAGKYWVTLRNQCGSSLDTVQLFSMSDLFVPNVLTVNADAKNENLRFKDIGSNFQATVRIFNRWGNEIFSKKNYHDEWPLSNDLPSSGSYYVVIEFAGCRTFKGWIEVVK
jgi:gliding motility-associated-like protein